MGALKTAAIPAAAPHAIISELSRYDNTFMRAILDPMAEPVATIGNLQTHRTTHSHRNSTCNNMQVSMAEGYKRRLLRNSFQHHTYAPLKRAVKEFLRYKNGKHQPDRRKNQISRGCRNILDPLLQIVHQFF